MAFFREEKGVNNWSNLPMGGGRGSKIISLKWMVPKQNRQKTQIKNTNHQKNYQKKIVKICQHTNHQKSRLEWHEVLLVPQINQIFQLDLT